MSFLTANAPDRGDETVDSKFAELVETNLWARNVFQPGITYSDKYQVDAMGQLFVRKLGKGTVITTDTLTFDHEQTEDELISIVLDKQFKQSEAIYEAVEVARTSGTGVQKFEVLARNVREAWQQEAHDQLEAGATASANTTATDADDVKDVFIEVRKELRDNDADPDVLICSTEFYSKILEYSGKEYQPAMGDEVIRTGIVGRFLGMSVIESTQLEDDGTAGSVEFIMYDHDAYSILTQLVASRIVDAGKDWAGSAAQLYIISGFKVTNEDRVFEKTVT